MDHHDFCCDGSLVSEIAYITICDQSDQEIDPTHVKEFWSAYKVNVCHS